MRQACPLKYIIKYVSLGCCLLSSVLTYSQLCQGSLGDPIINTTFGAGTNPGAPLSAAATGYQYISGDCPNDGFYTVRNSSISCFNNTWHSLVTDHTGDANGYFMLVNASFQPSAFYIDTVRGLCGSTTYEFAAWILNIIKSNACNGNPNHPNLTFQIEKTDGTVLQSYNTNTIYLTSTPTWQQHGFFFTTPSGISNIVLRMVNNAIGGCGNDLALDDITFRPCGPRVVPTIVGETSNMVNMCAGTGRTFNFISTVSDFFINPAYQWQQRFNGGAWADISGATSKTFVQIFTATTAVGTYEYRLAVTDLSNLGSPQCRVTSLPLIIIVNARPVATASNNMPVCNGKALALQANGGTQYTWAGPNSFSSTSNNPTINNIQFSETGTYTVIVANEAGCTDTAAFFVSVNPSPVVTTLFSDTTICIKNKVQLTAGGGDSYKWFPGAGLSSATVFNPIASPLISTRYGVVATNAFMCADTAYINVTVLVPVIANAGPDKTVIRGTPVTLEGSIQGQPLQYSWSPASAFSNPQVLQPVVMPQADAVYLLTATSANGCGSSADTVTVKVYKDIYVPTAFTPNGDGLNETWRIPALNAFPDFSLIVCNRLGQVVFINKFPNKPWDGKYKGALLPSGAYVYNIRLNGNNNLTLKGTVLLLR